METPETALSMVVATSVQFPSFLRLLSPYFAFYG